MTSANPLSPAQQALHHLALWLKRQGYDFITVTPETHRRLRLRHGDRLGTSLRDVFGWNTEFPPDLLPPEVLGMMREAGALETIAPSRARSRIRFASMDGLPYVHSAYPTVESDAVFCGPDTYRFAALVKRQLEHDPNVARIVDVGCGAGAGGLLACRWLLNGTGSMPRLVGIDINARAVEMARVNAAVFGCDDAVFRVSDLYRDMAPGIDLILANPPYLVDEDERLYRHGGGRFGAALSERIVREGLPLLSPGGRLVLYTGSAIEQGRDAFKEAVSRLVDPARFEVDYREIDPDVFGEELDREAYRDAERIAVVGLVVRRTDRAMAGGSP
jgi:methylase of polypeptide subunit release factors